MKQIRLRMVAIFEFKMAAIIPMGKIGENGILAPWGVNN
jgi:hypothetical protein